MKVILNQEQSIDGKTVTAGTVVDVPDNAAAYACSMGTASYVPEMEPHKDAPKPRKPVDRLDEAVAKDNPFLVGHAAAEGDDDLPVSKKAKK